MDLCPTVEAYSLGVPKHVGPRGKWNDAANQERALMRTPPTIGDWIAMNWITAISVLLIALAAPVWAGYDEVKPGRAASALFGQRIASIQRDLASLSYRPGRADGIMGRKTRRAIRAFQAKTGLPITGELSEELEVAIRAAKRTKSTSLADLKACQEAVDAEMWSLAMRKCRPLGENGSAGQSRLDQGINWLQAKLCRTLDIACL